MKSFQRFLALAPAVLGLEALFAAESGVTVNGSLMDAAAGQLQPARVYVRSAGGGGVFLSPPRSTNTGRR